MNGGVAGATVLKRLCRKLLVHQHIEFKKGRACLSRMCIFLVTVV